MYHYANLDPRQSAEAQAANEAVFALGPVLGIEVTIPKFAARCELGNNDPQHSGGDATLAAIEAAMTWPLPPKVAVLATVRADADSIGAMAVIAARAAGSEAALDALRIAEIASADTFARGPWPGARLMPTQEEFWDTIGRNGMAAISAMASDHKVPIDRRVTLMRGWLTGLLPLSALGQYTDAAASEHMSMVLAVENGEIARHVTANGRIAIVESAHRAALGIGYRLAPVVIAVNPAFRLGGGEPHRKITVAQRDTSHADIKASFADLSALEPGWGGSPTIGGSPQGVSSALTVEQIVGVVEKHLK